MKLSKILKEIMSGKRYDLSDPSVSRSGIFSDGTQSVTYTWEFMNAKGLKNPRMKNPNMAIVITMEYDIENNTKSKPSIVITFMKKGQSFDYKTESNDFYTILNTVVFAADEIIKKELGESATKDDLYKIGYQPADEQRDRIYKIIINRYYPQFKHSEDKKDKRSQYEWFVNKKHLPDAEITQPPQKETSSED